LDLRELNVGFTVDGIGGMIERERFRRRRKGGGKGGREEGREEGRKEGRKETVLQQFLSQQEYRGGKTVVGCVSPR
jgi:hypothetical protein